MRNFNKTIQHIFITVPHTTRHKRGLFYFNSFSHIHMFILLIYPIQDMRRRAKQL